MAARDETLSPDALVRPIVHELEAVASELSRMRDVLDALPDLMNDWVVGAPDEEQLLDIDVLAGPDAVRAAWERFAGRAACFVLPDARVLAEVPAAGAVGAPASGIRVILGAADEGARRVAIEEAARVGAEVRWIADPPSWFAVDDRDRCCYPSAWERGRPEYLLVLHDPVAAGGFRMLFEELWRRATPLDAGVPDWEAVVRLLDRGHTEGEVADILGLSERTVRRRIHEAGEALGASNRFTLGLAWAASVRAAP
jgi:hypothetical protein